MTLTDLRTSVQRHLYTKSSGRVIPSSLIGEVERLFDRAGTADDLIALFRDGLLHGAEVVTYAPNIAPAANVEILPLPYWQLPTLGTSASPMFRVVATWGWRGVQVQPYSDRSLFLPNTDLTELKLREAADSSALPHYLWVDGKNYEIATVIQASPGGSQIQLMEPLDGTPLRPRQASIHNGATSAVFQAKSGGSDVVSPHRVESRQFDGAPPFQAVLDVTEGEYDFKLTFRSPRESRSTTISKEIKSPRWSNPLVGPLVVKYEKLKISSDIGQANHFNRIEHNIVLRLAFDWRPQGAPPIVAIRYKITTETGQGERKSSAQTYWLTSDEMNTQRTEGVETLEISLGEAAPRFSREVSVSLMDAMGRNVQSFAVPLPALQDPSFYASTLLAEDFGRLVQVCAQPLSIDPATIGRKVSGEIDRMKVYAETVVGAHASTEISVQSTE